MAKVKAKVKKVVKKKAKKPVKKIVKKLKNTSIESECETGFDQTDTFDDTKYPDDGPEYEDNLP